jgi:hypothetical protein
VQLEMEARSLESGRLLIENLAQSVKSSEDQLSRVGHSLRSARSGAITLTVGSRGGVLQQ